MRKGEKQSYCIHGHPLVTGNLYFSGGNRTCKTCVKNRSEERWRKLSPTEKRAYMTRSVIRHTGRDPVEYEQKRHGVCALCGKREVGRSLCSDHDHSCCSGTKSCGNCTRDFLCRSCNQGIGFLLDSPRLMRAAADYVELWRQRHDSRTTSGMVSETHPREELSARG